MALLAIEVFADDVPPAIVQEFLFRLGRAYPAYWENGSQAGHCPAKVEWLSHDGAVAAVSDYDERKSYVSYVGRHRATRIASH